MPVQQHPIPQNVTQFQFRLVGDMTLKQFLELAAGLVIGLVFYASPLPFFFKWPLIIIAVATGASMAFLPIEGRPLEQWILAFIRSIYAPTIYTWQKESESNLSTISTSPVAPLPSPQPLPQITQLQPSTQPQVVAPTPTINTSPIPIQVSTESAPLPTTPYAPAPIYSHQPKPVFTSPTQPLQVEKQTINIPQEKKEEAPTPIPMPSTTITLTPTPGTTTTFSSNLPIPHPPETPNTIVGMTLTPDGKILESSIVEILKEGLTVRATKSNKLGQFLFAKPLDDGEYQLTAEKEGHTFPTFNLKLENQVISPIQLQATS